MRKASFARNDKAFRRWATASAWEPATLREARQRGGKSDETEEDIHEKDQ
ncbi:hypothetical protein [Nitratifractor sp.]